MKIKDYNTEYYRNLKIKKFAKIVIYTILFLEIIYLLKGIL
jgi:hypothetical protein